LSVTRARGTYCHPFSSFRKNFLAACLLRRHQNIEHFAILADRTLQVLQLAVDPKKNFIEMPPVAESTAAGTNPLGLRPTKLQTPLADALIADCDLTRGHHFSDVSVADCNRK
jgi:hypothetical protein